MFNDSRRLDKIEETQRRMLDAINAISAVIEERRLRAEKLEVWIKAVSDGCLQLQEDIVEVRKDLADLGASLHSSTNSSVEQIWKELCAQIAKDSLLGSQVIDQGNVINSIREEVTSLKDDAIQDLKDEITSLKEEIAGRDQAADC
jgi:DNA repair exonuclease SbcCD ATPase subunit